MVSAIETAAENVQIAKAYKDLLRISYQKLTAADKKMIRLALDTAVDAHKDQRRKSGDPYILHPIAVAKIVADDIGLGAPSISAALLHDVVEDTNYTIDDIETIHGTQIAKIVDGLTKISSLKKDKNVSLQAENFRKMLLTLNDDARVIIIKIADRLHNMQTMDVMPQHKQIKIASETLYIYAPLAHRIGMYNIKTELEDLGLKYTEPEVYNEIQQRVQENLDSQEQFIDRFIKLTKKHLRREGLSCKIEGRPKSIFSTRKKMISKNLDFDQIFDRYAIRIIYKSDPQEEKFLAWKIYSVITDHFQPNPLRLRDWISAPKSTGYEALHITVMGPEGRWVEVQIRSQRMHEIAEKGYAAHFKYKHGKQNERGLEVWLNRLREVLEQPNPDAVDFVKDFRLNLYASEIFVFTPEGDLKSLPQGATPVDFAFHIHTEIGMHTRGAKINGKIVPLSYRLRSGDQVEIITSEKSFPNPSWLDYVITSRARSRIRSFLREDKKQIAQEGKEILRRKLKQLKIGFNDKTIDKLLTFYKLKTNLDLFYRVGIGTIDNAKLKKFSVDQNNRFLNFFKRKTQTNTNHDFVEHDQITNKYDQLVFGKTEEQLEYQLSPCCNPIAGDDVFGFVTVSDGVKVHKNECPNALTLRSNYAYRIVNAKWIDSSQNEFTAKLQLTGLDDLGLVNKVTQVISNTNNVNISQMSFDSNDGTFEGNILLKVKNTALLKKMIKQLQNINGVDKVVRE
ncbi:MAG: RelA/SpoT family protein [Flavobacteriaceae bacterium]|jgi:GTP pyrophosphokinase|nr:RelA/SpoT family protein [Flavobacteriaceae bacterium]MBR63091.1 RelA/SpoT family protein [Flavobacteriaceae bacterium]|tara:strand:- start:3589 stop:5796 length:2208 start_codon:yes stop_codon:yes gene_type:complete